MAQNSSGGPERKANRLAKETSPYLLQHQYNPVDWYPWGPEAFEVARREDRPIFLSVGYSTCYWCHVMERQSFEDERVAAEMNKRFVCIKVDREERPDVDQLYMTAVQVLTGHGGWPMSVWLLPDLRPFYGGTYFPPSDTHGRPGFVRVCEAIEDAYRNRRGEVEESAEQIVGVLEKVAEPRGTGRPVTIDAEFIESLVARSASDYDAEFGGFGRAPKFPRQTVLELLLSYVDWEGADARRRDRVMQMLIRTFDAMADGGIRDQLGGGFHRYSTDQEWLVPHFEIMLYDNAMLGWCYVEMHRQTGDRRYADVARGIFDFVLREMTSPDGAFYTAFDAEVDAQEGLSYLWTKDEIEEVLGESDAAVFNRVYGVDEGPNFADPHHGSGQPDKNILHLPEPMAVVAGRMKVTAEELERRLQPMREKLLQARAKRKQPLLDTKVLTSWNALMIRALAYGGQVLEEPRYLDAAARCARFLLRQHRTPDGGLYRTTRDGVKKYDAFLDDYAFMVLALTQLWEATGEGEWREWATEIEAVMAARFEDRDRGGFYYTAAGADDLIVRQKVGMDSPLPSGNGAAAMAMLALDDVHDAGRVLRAFAGAIAEQGEGMSTLVQAALGYVRVNGPLNVDAADEEGADAPLSVEQVARSVVDVEARWVTVTQLNVRLSVAAGFHINAHQAGAGLIRTDLSVEGAEVSEIVWPPGEVRAFAFAAEGIRVYEGDVIVEVRARRTAERVRVAVRYQACDEESCLSPVTKVVDAGAGAS